MEKFHEDVYRFIYAMITSPEVKKKVRTVMNELGSRFFECQAAAKYHQDYEGGLADHTALVVLDAYHSAITKKWMRVDPDDAIVSALFHDLDKIGNPHHGNANHGPSVANDDIAVVEYLDKFGLRNAQIQDGIILAHGGWSKVKDVEHPPIAIIVHAADMLASHATKTEKDTREKIERIMKLLLKILDKRIAKERIRVTV
jgi:23S rRNA maturation-related 3'-5' exoribonuclease YhaM